MRPTRRSSERASWGRRFPLVPHSGEFKPKKAELRILDVFRPTCGVFLLRTRQAVEATKVLPRPPSHGGSC